MTDTMKRLRGYLEDMFGPERAAALKDDDKPWCEHVGAKTIDMIDIERLIAREFGVPPFAQMPIGSLAELAAHIDALTPSTDAH